MSRPLVAALILLGVSVTARPVTTDTLSPLETVLAHPPAAITRPGLEDTLPAVSAFYQTRDYQPVWTNATGLTPAGERVMRTLARANEDGLNPEDYDPALLASLAAAHTADSAATLEIVLSSVAVRFANDIGWGITVPSEVDRANSYNVRPFDASAVLNNISTADDPGDALQQYAPPSFVYGLVKQALADLRDQRARGGWTHATAGPTLRKNDRGPRVAELRAILMERGDLPKGPADDRFDAALVEGLKRFQDRHGLGADGIYGKNVL
ncbi:MAG: peptidoglycan-binding protein, partial [Acidobacteriaceae bacterium]|nr:peptidoglycan-binding protein [Acidobacteriaceae bacterium]